MFADEFRGGWVGIGSFSDARLIDGQKRALPMKLCGVVFLIECK